MTHYVATRNLTDSTTDRIREVLAGQRGALRSALLFAGPAVIASIAYVDPGNFATNIQAGAGYGYALLWVVVLANLIAMLFQALSAKLGIVTGRNLAEMCRERFRAGALQHVGGQRNRRHGHRSRRIPGRRHRPVAAAAPASDRRHGGDGGRHLRNPDVRRPRLPADGADHRRLCRHHRLLLSGRNVHRAGRLGTGRPRPGAPSLPDARALTIAVGIVGATVMPHAIYLHSGLTQNRAPARNDVERRKLLRFSTWETIVALTVAGAVNIAMVIMAAAAFHAGHADVAEIGTAYHSLTPLLGGAAAGVFLVSLLASGISSSAVGTMAGQMIMQGFVGFRIPIWLRRLVTMLPAFVVVAMGVNATDALVYSQVVLSFALPVPIIALVLFTRDRAVMREFANGRLTDAAAIAGTLAVLALNAILLLQTFNVPIPGLAAV